MRGGVLRGAGGGLSSFGGGVSPAFQGLSSGTGISCRLDFGDGGFCWEAGTQQHRAAAEQGDEEAIEATTNVESLRRYLYSSYENLGYDPAEIPDLVERDVSEYTAGQGGYATGGRVNFNRGALAQKFRNYLARTPTTPQAALEVSSTTSGILIPRMTEAQRDLIPIPLNGMLVFVTDGTIPGFFSPPIPDKLEPQ